MPLVMFDFARHRNDNGIIVYYTPLAYIDDLTSTVIYRHAEALQSSVDIMLFRDKQRSTDRK